MPERPRLVGRCRALAILASALLLLMLAIAPPASAQSAPDKVKGVAYVLPDWFKASFMDLREDVADARKSGRHLLLFLHLDNCPYCARMIADSFTRGPNREFMGAHFDVVAINVRGSVEVTWTDGATYTEQSLARHLKAFATPTLVFLGSDGRIVLQLAGYQDPPALRQALDYVQSESYRRVDFKSYLSARKKGS